MYNITNAANISFTTVYNAESDFTIFYKIYNGSLNILYNVYNTANNTKSGFTIYCKIYNGALRTLTILRKIYNGSLNVLSDTAKYVDADAYIVAPQCWIHIAICTMIYWMLVNIHIFPIKDDKRHNLLI